MKSLALCLAVLTAPAMAETAYPALHDVTGVAADDVLNLRAAPDAGAAIIGSLPPGLAGVEVAGLSPDGKWGRVNLGEVSGWAAMSFLNPQGGPAWFAVQGGLQCRGTEPFWTFHLDPETKTARFVTPEGEGPKMTISALWPGDDWHPVVGAQVTSNQGWSIATIRSETCSDGMSDAVYGLASDIFSKGTTAAPASSLRGCCTLAP